MEVETSNKIALVMATCNGAAFIEQQLDSIMQQTRRIDLVIIRDDASTDSTFQILSRYANEYGFQVSRNSERLGVNENFTRAVAEVPDNYIIAFCDQDDYWLPEKLEKSIALLQQIATNPSEPALVYSDLVLMNEAGEILHHSVHRQRGQHRYAHVWETFLFGNMVSGCTILMNAAMKKIMLELPRNQSFIYDAWLAMAAFGFGKIAQLSEPLIQYRQHSKNVTFSEHHSKNRIERLLDHWKLLFQSDTYLQEEIQLATAFHSQYANRLSAAKKESLEKFISLQHKPYLIKKLRFELNFRNHWINRFAP